MQHEVRGGEDAGHDDEDEGRSENDRSVTSKRSGTRTAQTKGAAKSGLSVRSGLSSIRACVGPRHCQLELPV